jgi:hypothetical protein
MAFVEPSQTMLSIADSFQILGTNKTFSAFAGHSTSYLADAGAPYEAEMQAYSLQTTRDEIARVQLKEGDLVRGPLGFQYKILTFTPDGSGWSNVKVEWSGKDKPRESSWILLAF